MLETNVTSAGLDEQHQGPGLEAHVMLKLAHSSFRVAPSISYPTGKTTQESSASYFAERRLLRCFLPFFPPLFWALGLAFQCQKLYLPLDNIAVQRSLPTNNEPYVMVIMVIVKDQGHTWGNCFHIRL